MVHKQIAEITDRIIARSSDSRSLYLDQMSAQFDKGISRAHLSCGNLVHGFAGCGSQDKASLSESIVPNIGIISAYNDMLSAHRPFETYPGLIKEALQSVGAVGQVAGGVPAMCDGVTQGQPGMELSLFLRRPVPSCRASRQRARPCTRETPASKS